MIHFANHSWPYITPDLIRLASPEVGHNAPRQLPGMIYYLVLYSPRASIRVGGKCCTISNMALKRWDVARIGCDVEIRHLVSIRHEKHSWLLRSLLIVSLDCLNLKTGRPQMSSISRNWRLPQQTLRFQELSQIIFADRPRFELSIWINVNPTISWLMICKCRISRVWFVHGFDTFSP